MTDTNSEPTRMPRSPFVLSKRERGDTSVAGKLLFSFFRIVDLIDAKLLKTDRVIDVRRIVIFEIGSTFGIIFLYTAAGKIFHTPPEFHRYATILSIVSIPIAVCLIYLIALSDSYGEYKIVKKELANLDLSQLHAISGSFLLLKKADREFRYLDLTQLQPGAITTLRMQLDRISWTLILKRELTAQQTEILRFESQYIAFILWEIALRNNLEPTIFFQSINAMNLDRDYPQCLLLDHEYQTRMELVKGLFDGRYKGCVNYKLLLS